MQSSGKSSTRSSIHPGRFGRLKSYSLLVEDRYAGMRLDQMLAEWLPQALGKPLSKSKIRRLVVAGAVYLNGTRVRIASKPLRARARIDVYVDQAKLEDSTQADRSFTMTQAQVLFEDEYLIAVDKPAGIPTQATLDDARDHLFAAVKRFLRERDGVAEPYLGLHHRLDRDTSGVILFTKKKEANAGVAALFSGRKAQKSYLAIVHASAPGKIPDEFEVENFLGRATGTGKSARYTAVRSGGDAAHTSFRVVERFPGHGLGADQGAVLIEARPHTGRTHQIRVHLAESGLPIFSDRTYGPENRKADRPGELAPRLMLHAASLTITHPISETRLAVQSPLPEDFARCLNMLRPRK